MRRPRHGRVTRDFNLRDNPDRGHLPLDTDAAMDDALRSRVKNDPADWSRSLFLRASVVAAGALIVGIGLPLLVGKLDGGYTDNDVLDLVRTSHPEVGEALAKYYLTVESWKAARARVDDRLLTTETRQAADVNADLALRNHLDRLIAGTRPPFATSGVYFSNIMALWPLAYFFLGIQACVVGRSFVWKLGSAVTIWIFLFPVYRWPTWFRNSPWGKAGRVVFAEENWDVSPVGFLRQEIMAALLCFLVAVIWAQFLQRFRDEAQPRSVMQEDDPINAAFDTSRHARITDALFQWQLSSVVLFGAFGYYTFYFWDTVKKQGDVRFILHAVIVHLVWLITWILVTAPLVVAWRQWSANRSKALAALAFDASLSKDQADRMIKVIESMQPASAWTLTGSSLGAVVALLLPVLQLIWK